MSKNLLESPPYLPYEVRMERMIEFFRHAVIGIRQFKIERVVYCEIRYRDHIWCGVAVCNPSDEWNQYRGWRLAAIRAARACAPELNFDTDGCVRLLKKYVRVQSIIHNMIVPTEWELEEYKDLLGYQKEMQND